MDSRQRLWLWAMMALAGVTLGQFGLVAQLFGPFPQVALASDQPIVSGRHPLHLYHASLGVDTFRERWSTTCYDPAFQAGYLKTPVFDDGARLPELFLLIQGAGFSAKAYKQGLFALLLLIPVGFAVAAWGLNIGPTGCVLAALLGALLTWSPTIRPLIDQGDLDHLFAGLMALAFLGALVRYTEHPGVHSWLFFSVTVALGWFAHPLLWCGLVPVGAIYYFAVAPKHGLSWHLGLVGIACAGLAPNLWWLADWLQFWWIRQPGIDEIAQIPHWEKILGESKHYTELLGPGPLGVLLFVGGLLGLLHLLREGRSLTALLLGLTVLMSVCIVRLADTWPALQMFHFHRVAPFTVTLMSFPLAAMLGTWWDRCSAGRLALLAGASAIVMAGWFPQACSQLMMTLQLQRQPLNLGLTPSQRDWLDQLRNQTNDAARILIEDLDSGAPNAGWTAMLPVLTQRSFLGGLDRGSDVDLGFCGLTNRSLNGRVFSEWSQRDRDHFLTRYNVGWVWCRSPSAIDWWATEPRAKVVARGSEGLLFQLQREPSFILSGEAKLERADRRKLVFTDVVPNEQGEVVLSFHGLPGMRVSPTVVKLDSEKDVFDPTPFIKLKLPSPLSRVVITWDHR